MGREDHREPVARADRLTGGPPLKRSWRRVTPFEGTWLLAPCGCGFGIDENTGVFVFEGCSPECELYLYAVAEAEAVADERRMIDA